MITPENADILQSPKRTAVWFIYSDGNNVYEY